MVLWLVETVHFPPGQSLTAVRFQTIFSFPKKLHHHFYHKIVVYQKPK
jgi:hypothetical protein